MYSLLKTSTSVPKALAEQAPPLVVSFMIAETFYKFGSFALECAGFLGTWFVLDAALQGVLKLVRRKGER